MKQRIGIQIHRGDNVVTIVDEGSAGDRIVYVTPQGSREIAVLGAVPFGHKVALKDVQAGEPIVKYNEVIGTASRAIKRGEHVHVHNVESAVQGVAK